MEKYGRRDGTRSSSLKTDTLHEYIPYCQHKYCEFYSKINKNIIFKKNPFKLDNEKDEKYEFNCKIKIMFSITIQRKD